MNINLTGKNALVGASTSGIGKAIAMQLAQSGASVTLMSRDAEKLKKVSDALPRKDGQQHHWLQVDFADHEDFQGKISAFFEENTIDILVNNTQGPPAGTALEKEVADYQKAFNLLFKNVVLTTELALKNMRKNQWGRVINVASVSVQEPLPHLVLSNSIRAAVVTWGKSLATAVGPDQITVNSILTGYFDTPRIEQLNQKKAEVLGVSQKEIRQQMEDAVPVRRLGVPKEYGYLVAFLASEKAAFLTGTKIPLDGGLLQSL
ncbi:MAG: SDR family oxidoreductase [Leeuwenhoekiella sp.]